MSMRLQGVILVARNLKHKVNKMIDEKQFKEMVGREPQEDELELCNCQKAGTIGHNHCGVCELHNQPRNVCGCFFDLKNKEIVEDKSKMKKELSIKEVERRIQAVKNFEPVVLSKLLENTYKGTWEDYDMAYLVRRLKEEVKELEEAIKEGGHNNIRRECGDIVAFTIMIDDKIRNAQ